MFNPVQKAVRVEWRAGLAALLVGCTPSPLPVGRAVSVTAQPNAPQDAEPRPRRGGHLDASRAFFYPIAARGSERDGVDRGAAPVAWLGATGIDAATFARYRAGHDGPRLREELAFDLALARECAVRRLAGSAPVLARSSAAARFPESGRSRADDPDGSLQLKFANQALRQYRLDALVRQARRGDETSVRGLFERRYGVGGVRVQVRQLLVSFDATRRRLPAGSPESKVVDAARTRVRALCQRLRTGEAFDRLLRESDDRLTRRLLRDPAKRQEAGYLQGYNYRRYGDAFAAAVRRLQVGECSDPVRSSVGFHIIELVDRKVTPFAEVEAAMRQIVERGPATPAEVAHWRRQLLKKYGFTLVDPGR